MATADAAGPWLQVRLARRFPELGVTVKTIITDDEPETVTLMCNVQPADNTRLWTFGVKFTAAFLTENLCALENAWASGISNELEKVKRI
jgi:hypothetical protein